MEITVKIDESGRVTSPAQASPASAPPSGGPAGSPESPTPSTGVVAPSAGAAPDAIDAGAAPSLPLGGSRGAPRASSPDRHPGAVGGPLDGHNAGSAPSTMAAGEPPVHIGAAAGFVGEGGQEAVLSAGAAPGMDKETGSVTVEAAWVSVEPEE
jgi:hypothetical protein